MIPLVDIRCGYTVTELAYEMNRSERTIRRWIADHQIQPVGRTHYGSHRYLLAEFVAAEFVAREKRRVTLLGRFSDGMS